MNVRHCTPLRKKLHMNFNLKAVGLTVKTDKPYLTASPNGVFSCGCSGTGVLEIKHPMDICDFMVWTKTSSIICWQGRDEHFLQETLPKAGVFFIDHLLPESVTAKTPTWLKRSNVCTYCCQQFHYACVNITRHSKKW